MSFRSPIVATAAVLTAMVLTSHTHAQNFRDAQIEPVKVADSVYMLKGVGGNIGVSIGEDGVFMIDDQYAPLTGKILAAVGRFTGGEVRFEEAEAHDPPAHSIPSTSIKSACRGSACVTRIERSSRETARMPPYFSNSSTTSDSPDSESTRTIAAGSKVMK